MLTSAEMTDARAKLEAAGALVEAVRLVFLNASYSPGAHTLDGVAEEIADEISALDKLIAGEKQ